MIHVLLADDHPAVRAGIRSAIEKDPQIKIVAEADSGESALRLIEELEPDVVILDCRLRGGMDGVQVARSCRAKGYTTRVLALSAYDDTHYVEGMLQAGVAGYLLKVGDGGGGRPGRRPRRRVV